MKQIFISILILILTTSSTFAKTDKCSEEYLKSKKHFAILNPLAEKVAEKTIKKSLKKESDGKYDIKFDGYTFSSMKKGVFKNLEIEGQDLVIEEIPIPYLSIKTVSDYNYIDYSTKPIKFKSNMLYAYTLKISEDSINKALEHKDYQKTLDKINNIAYPLFVIRDVNIKIKNNRIYMIIDYNFPIAPKSKNRTFVASSKLKIDKTGKISVSEVGIDKSYGNISSEKVSNLLNLLDPSSFTLNIINEKKCNGKIEKINIDDNIIQIDGKIYVKGE